MNENLILSFRAVFPVFILVIIGALLKKTKFLTDDFYPAIDKLVFKITLPLLIFLNIARANLNEGKEFIKIGLGVIPLIAALGIVYIILCAVFVKDKKRAGAMTQGMIHANLAILGLAFIGNVFPDVEMSKTAEMAFSIVMPFAVITQNIISVVALSLFSPDVKSGKSSIKQFGLLFINILKNPLIIAAFCGIPFMIFNINLPPIADKTFNYLSGMTTPLALISLGAGFSFKSFHKNIIPVLLSSVVKIIIHPIVALLTFYMLKPEIKGYELLVVFFIFGTPTAVASFVMSKNMNSDHELSGQIVMMTTLMCIVTVFFGLYFMREFNWI